MSARRNSIDQANPMPPSCDDALSRARFEILRGERCGFSLVSDTAEQGTAATSETFREKGGELYLPAE